MFNFGKKKREIQVKKQREKGIEPNLSKSQVSIVIKRLMGGRVPVTVASFIADQKRESDFNLQLIEKNHNFKEDVSFSNAHIIETLKYRLDFGSKTNEEKIKEVKKKIAFQEKRLKGIDKGYLLETDTDGKPIIDSVTGKSKRTKVNLIDEENKLDQYKVLLECVKNEGDGSYEEIRKDGLKQLTFLYDEGVLYPYFWNVTKHTIYPDRGTKRKIHKPEQDLIDREFLEDTKSPFGGFSKNLAWVLFVILFIGTIFWNVKLMGYSGELNELRAEIEAEKVKCTTECAEYISETARANSELIKYATDKIEQEMKEKNENNKNDGNIIDLG